MSNPKEFQEQVQKVIELNDDIASVIRQFTDRYNSLIRNRNSIIQSTISVAEAINDPEVCDMIHIIGKPITKILTNIEIDKLASGDYKLFTDKEQSLDFIDPSEIDKLIPIIGHFDVNDNDNDNDEFGIIPNDTIPHKQNSLYMDVSSISSKNTYPYFKGESVDINYDDYVIDDFSEPSETM